MLSRTSSIMVSGLMVLVSVLASCAPAAAPTAAPTGAAPILQPAAKPAASPEAKPAGTSAPPSPSPKPAVEQPTYGGTLLLNEAADPPNLDMHTSLTVYLLHPLMPVYNGIVQYDPLDPNKVIGDLAEKWEVSPDGKVLTFRLHREVRWHDGKVFTANDAKFSLERMMDPKTRSPRAEYLKPIENMEAPDAGTLKLNLKQAFNLVPLLAQGWMLVLPPHVIQAKGDMRRDAMGTGPFKLKEYSPGILWKLERNKDYFIKGRPFLDGVITYIIRDSSVRAAAFRTGNVHITVAGSTAVTRSQVESIVRTNPKTVVHPYDSLGTMGVDINHNARPWGDVRVRKAATLAIDRESAIKVVGEGDGFIASHFPRWGVPSDELLKRPGWRQAKEADRAEARRLLAEAGYPDGFKVRVLVRSTGEHVKAAQFVQDQLRTVGIEAVLDQQDPGIVLAWEQEGKYEVLGRGGSYYLYDPYDIGKKYVTGAALAGTSGALQGYSSPKYDELFYKQGAMLDEVERRKVVREMDEVLLEEVPAIIYMWRAANVLASPRVRNYKPGVGGYNNFRSQDVWLAP